MSFRHTGLLIVLGLLISPAWSAPGDVNSVNDGPTVTGGIYYNTFDSHTVFTNTTGGSVTLPAAATIRAYETIGTTPATAALGMTGNGGKLLFYAPNSVVRLDGNVDVSGVLSGGAYTGNGGRVSVVSSFLYTNGNIYANGMDGGIIDFNVGSLMMGPNTRIEAKGNPTENFLGSGGAFVVNANNIVRMAKGALVDVSGQYIGSYNSNIINISGSVVNVQGILKANGIRSEGGSISLMNVGEQVDPAIWAADLDNPALADIKSQLVIQVNDMGGSANDANYATMVIGPYAEVLANGSNGADEALNLTYGGGGRVGDGGGIFIGGGRYMNILYDGESGALISARGGNATGGLNGGHGGSIYGTGLGTSFAGRLHAQGGNGYGFDEDRYDNLPGGLGGNGGYIGFFNLYGFTNQVIPKYNKFTLLNAQKMDEHYAQINASGGHNGVGNDDPNTFADDPPNAYGGIVQFMESYPPRNYSDLSNVMVYRGLAADGRTFDANRFGSIMVTKLDPTLVSQSEILNTNFKNPPGKAALYDYDNPLIIDPVSPRGAVNVDPLPPPPTGEPPILGLFQEARKNEPQIELETFGDI